MAAPDEALLVSHSFIPQDRRHLCNPSATRDRDQTSFCLVAEKGSVDLRKASPGKKEIQRKVTAQRCPCQVFKETFPQACPDCLCATTFQETVPGIVPTFLVRKKKMSFSSSEDITSTMHY